MEIEITLCSCLMGKSGKMLESAIPLALLRKDDSELVVLSKGRLGNADLLAWQSLVYAVLMTKSN